MQQNHLQRECGKMHSLVYFYLVPLVASWNSFITPSCKNFGFENANACRDNKEHQTSFLAKASVNPCGDEFNPEQQFLNARWIVIDKEEPSTRCFKFMLTNQLPNTHEWIIARVEPSPGGPTFFPITGPSECDMVKF